MGPMVWYLLRLCSRVWMGLMVWYLLKLCSDAYYQLYTTCYVAALPVKIEDILAQQTCENM